VRALAVIPGARVLPAYSRARRNPPAAPARAFHTAWLPRSCSSGDMGAAFMQ
jgi:hypothetical protein